MNFDPVSFYLLAGALHCSKELDSTLDEAKYRTSISKSYYAAFLKAREGSSVTTRSESVHKQVIDFYKGKRKESLSNRLDSLRIMRGNADYDMDCKITGRESGNALSLSRKILEELGENFLNK